MATVTRVNGLNVTAGTTYNLNANIFRIRILENGGTPVDLRDEDDAVNETVEVIIGELNPLVYHVVDDSTGYIHIVTDKSISGKDIKTRIRNLGSAVGPNAIDVTGTLVYIAELSTGDTTEVDA